MSSFNFEPSGKVKAPTAEELLLADQEDGVLVLSRGIQPDGNPYYAYICVLPSMYEEFTRVTEEKVACNLEQFGEVIFADSESEPPEVVVEFMRDCYGFDEDFQPKLLARMKDERKEFIETQEKKRVLNIVEMMKKQKPAGTA